MRDDFARTGLAFAPLLGGLALTVPANHRWEVTAAAAFAAALGCLSRFSRTRLLAAIAAFAFLTWAGVDFARSRTAHELLNGHRPYGSLAEQLTALDL